MGEARPAVTNATSDRSYDSRFGFIAFGLLFVAIVFSTYLHHFQPQVLKVPNNTNVSTWKNPTLEQTTIYDRMTESERARIRSEGIPQGNDVLGQFLTGDLFIILLGWLCFRHARRHFGFWMASCFLIGSFVFTGLEESMWILFGRFMPASSVNGLGEPVHGTYWFTKGGLWFLETPVTACVGWFFIAYSCVAIAGKTFPRMNLWGRAAVGGLIAMVIDLWMDPVSTSPELMNWVWAKGDLMLIFGIPHTNFLGWFLLIFLFAIFWENLPRMELRWGRTKATVNFFIMIFGTEICILIFFMVWMGVFGKVLSSAGLEHAIQIPLGW